MISRRFQTKTNHKGEFVFNREKILTTLRAAADQPIEIIIQNWDPQRSLNWNGYYWGVIVKGISDHFQWDPPDTHELLKNQNKEMLDPVYEAIPIAESPAWISRMVKKLNLWWRPEPVRFTTSTLSRSRFIAYCQKIQRDYAEQGCYIPDPGECEASYN